MLPRWISNLSVTKSKTSTNDLNVKVKKYNVESDESGSDEELHDNDGVKEPEKKKPKVCPQIE